MNKHTYKIQLRKDAELGTGLGGETVNSLVPRDSDGNPVIPASHIKGLMRASLRMIAEHRTGWQDAFDDGELNWPDAFIRRVFGAEDEQNSSYEPTIRLEAAHVDFDASDVKESIALRDANDDEDDGGSSLIEVPQLGTRLVTRTAIEVNGIAKDTSLRTTESIPKNTVFGGTYFTDRANNSIEGLALRLALLSIPAVGGSRNRGGQCVVHLSEDADLKPGKLLKELDTAISERRQVDRVNCDSRHLSAVNQLSESTAVIELLFVADSPICCPERPDKTNVIVGGFSIPATSVQGIVLNHINRRNPSLATDLFGSSNFRCWPLNPCHDPNFDRARTSSGNGAPPDLEQLPYAIRVSLSHRAAKVSADKRLKQFFDQAFGPRAEAYDWREKPEYAPLKGADGVLLFGGAGKHAGPLLWRANSMPHQITTHGVLDGPRGNADTSASGRNLFSVDAMAPLIWRGIISVPENLASSLVDSLNASPDTSIGKGKTVRGLGKLTARRMPDESKLFAGAADQRETALVLQSPALIPDKYYQELVSGKITASHVLREMAKDWLDHHQLPRLAGDPDVWASVDIRFGWNRHNPNGAFQEAAPVLAPGSVFTLESKADPEKISAAVLAGFHANPDETDAGRQRGFGAIAVHPGQAREFYGEHAKVKRVFKSTPLRAAMELVLRMEALPHLPSSSQIRAVEQRIIDTADDAENKKSLDAAKKYLAEQCSRLLDVWYAWEPIVDGVEKILTDFESSVAKKALKSLADIAVFKRKENQ